MPGQLGYQRQALLLLPLSQLQVLLVNWNRSILGNLKIDPIQTNMCRVTVWEGWSCYWKGL